MTLMALNVGEKSADLPSTFVMQAAGSEMSGGQQTLSGGRIQKKHVLIVVSAVAIVGLIIAGILVGMYMFSETQKEIIKFSLQFKTSKDEQASQDVVSDPNDNVVMFHVTKPGQDVYVVNDFNKDLQVVKIAEDGETNCYIAPLNRSEAMDPSRITNAASLTGSEASKGQTFVIAENTVKDTSFLTKKARDMCTGVSVYWAYRHCGVQASDARNRTDEVTSPLDRSKRTVRNSGSYYGLPCKTSYCVEVCACAVRITETYSGNRVKCTTYATVGTCCGRVARPYCNTAYYWY